MSLRPGIGRRGRTSDIRQMSAAALMDIAPAASSRLLADVQKLHGRDSDARESALDRLEAALGRDFADQLVAALSDEREARERSRRYRC